MQRLAVFAEILGAGHQLPHVLQCSLGLLRDDVPRPLETSNGRSSWFVSIVTMVFLSGKLSIVDRYVHKECHDA